MSSSPHVVRAARKSAAPVAASQAAWALSFADLMTLLMCMFVFMYSYAEMNASRFREISESMRSAFVSESNPSGVAQTAASKASSAVDLLSKAFAAQLASGQITVESRAGSLLIKLGEAGAFGSGEAVLSPMALQLIARVAVVARAGNARLVIGGHTDNVPIRNGRYQDNWDLSAARAIAVVRELVERQGMDPKQIEAQGFGDTRPAAPNDTAEHRVANRRIEIAVVW
jgi:chemotaxis protein MotB